MLPEIRWQTSLNFRNLALFRPNKSLQVLMTHKSLSLFGNEPCHLHTTPGWFVLRVFKCLCGNWKKYQSFPPSYPFATLCTRLLGVTRCIPIGDFRNVFKFHAYSVNKRLFLTTAKLVRGLSDVATTNVCKVDTSNRNHIERSRWMKWLITGLRQKKYPLIWIHYESPLFGRAWACV